MIHVDIFNQALPRSPPFFWGPCRLQKPHFRDEKQRQARGARVEGASWINTGKE